MCYCTVYSRCLFLVGVLSVSSKHTVTKSLIECIDFYQSTNTKSVFYGECAIVFYSQGLVVVVLEYSVQPQHEVCQ